MLPKEEKAKRATQARAFSSHSPGLVFTRSSALEEHITNLKRVLKKKEKKKKRVYAVFGAKEALGEKRRKSDG